MIAESYRNIMQSLKQIVLKGASCEYLKGLFLKWQCTLSVQVLIYSQNEEDKSWWIMFFLLLTSWISSHHMSDVCESPHLLNDLKLLFKQQFGRIISLASAKKLACSSREGGREREGWCGRKIATYQLLHACLF